MLRLDQHEGPVQAFPTAGRFYSAGNPAAPSILDGEAVTVHPFAVS
ncbi:MAG TPA: hypothetical protein VD964_09345 [Azospirillum sp.]|nr:hypothetical protein [Azospirillum sp.]